MIRLNLSRENCRVDLGGGAWIELAPLSSALVARAQSELPEDLEGRPPTEIEAVLVSRLAALAAVAWDGIAAADGTPVPISAEAVAELMDWWPAWNRVKAAWFAPYLTVVIEGNVSAPLPSGTTAGAPITATPAGRAAENARTALRSRKPRKAG